MIKKKQNLKFCCLQVTASTGQIHKYIIIMSILHIYISRHLDEIILTLVPKSKREEIKKRAHVNVMDDEGQNDYN